MALCKANDAPILSEIRQRLIHIEAKADRLLQQGPGDGEYRGSPSQRYGHITYSQHGEDLVFVALMERFGIDRPTYLDIGANHPTDCSNTALLYQRGARGVNVDASPDVIKLFERDRPDDQNINVGVASQAGTMTFYRFGETSGRSTFSRQAADRYMADTPNEKIHDEIVVPVMTLDQIIDTYFQGKYPDLLSIDAEGLDYDILAAASFATPPKILCVETLSTEGDLEARIDELLIGKGFRKCIQMFANAVYIGRDIKL